MFFRKNFINLLFSNKKSVKPQFVATRVSSNIRSLADLIGGNPTGEYSRENQIIQLFFQTIVFVLDKPKDKFSKQSIIRHSIFHQHSCIARPNWREFEWRIFVGKPGTTIIFSETIVFVLEENSVNQKRSSVNSRLSAGRFFVSIRVLADIIGGNSSGIYLRENQVVQLVFRNHIFCFGRKLKYSDKEVH